MHPKDLPWRGLGGPPATYSSQHTSYEALVSEPGIIGFGGVAGFAGPIFTKIEKTGKATSSVHIF